MLTYSVMRNKLNLTLSNHYDLPEVNLRLFDKKHHVFSHFF